VLTLYANGKQLHPNVLPDGSYRDTLQPGTYVLGVTWVNGGTTPETYQVAIFTPQQHESATPLTIGPAPALRLQLVSDAPPPTSQGVLPPPPPPVLPPLPELPPADPAPVPVDNTPIVASAPIQEPASPPEDIGAVSVFSVSVNTPAPTPAVAPGTSSGQGVAAVVAGRSPTTPSLPPYLVQALSEGPLGGVSGPAPVNAIPAPNSGQAGQYTSPLVAGFGPSSAGSLLADESGPVEEGASGQTASVAMESSSVEPMQRPVSNVAQGFASLDSALQLFESWWTSQRWTAPLAVATQAQPPASAPEIVALVLPSAETADLHGEAWPASAPTQFLKWVAIAGLGVTWGVINAKKTWVARRPGVCSLERNVS
jgi:hypothetical protein